MIPIVDDDDFGVRSKPTESGEGPDVDFDLLSTQERATVKELTACNDQTHSQKEQMTEVRAEKQELEEEAREQENEDKPEQRRNPTRDRKESGYLCDYICGFENDVT